jgi:DNA-binding transcriptional ArsR family regulator
MNNIKLKFQFVTSAVFEPFFALQTLTDKESRIHEQWKRKALLRLPSSFHKKFTLIGGSPYIWPAIPDTLQDAPLSAPFEEIISRIAQLPEQDLQKAIFFGILHEPGPVNNLLSGRADLFQTISRISKAKHEWLAFMGLYPATKNSPLFAGLEFLLRTPKEFQKILVDLLEMFWVADFKETWNVLYEELEKSREEKERLFQSCSLEEFARFALLRVEVDEKKRLLKAVRGGYVLPFNRLSAVYVIPSAFNDKRHWTCSEKDPKQVIAYFPYFDPAISLSWISRPSETEIAEPEKDPALIFKALGDTTRYAMVSLLARGPLTSSDLATELGISRPTVSHHIHVLRDAGLLEEKIQGNAAVLSVRREILEHLSDLTIGKLFDSTEKIDLRKTRTK